MSTKAAWQDATDGCTEKKSVCFTGNTRIFIYDRMLGASDYTMGFRSGLMISSASVAA